MKYLVVILGLCFASSSWGNMASPIYGGTWGASPFISARVDVIEERIDITLNKSFTEAHYEIEYHLLATDSGQQIPLLFYAFDYKNYFKIWVDDVPVTIQKLPSEYEAFDGKQFSQFDYLFAGKEGYAKDHLLLEEDARGGFYLDANDLKFFEIDLTQGEHVVRVSYDAEPYVSRADWVRETGFRYALSPAKHWKSFGKLTITVDASAWTKDFQTNLNEITSERFKGTQTWEFDQLPIEVFKLTYVPEISPTAKRLIAISPFGLALIFTIVVLIAHLFAARKYRRRNPTKKYSWVVIVGGILVPLICLVAYILSFSLIDAAIGEDASRFHGYTFLVLFTYPVIFPIYWLVIYLLDKQQRRSISNRNS